MNYRVIGLEQSEEWNEALRNQGQTDIYFLPEYHLVHELNGDGIASAFVAQQDAHVLIYPFMMRHIIRVGSEPIKDQWFDIETVYGYGGPLANTTAPDFLAGAWDAFSAWCEDARVVAEFIRFHPLLESQRFADPSCVMSLDRETVVLELDKGEEGLWRSYSSVHRNMIRKAQKSGLRCAEVDPKGEMEAFKGLYLETMRRAHAARYYFFSDRYFEALVHLLGDRLRLFVVRHGDLIVAASLFLVYGETVHYHLSAGLESYRSLGPTNLLLHWVALWCLAEGHRYLHLGGGRTSSPDDSLLRFKASISKVRRGYYTGRRIRNATEYESLCRKWMRLHRVVERPDYFLLYRLEG